MEKNAIISVSSIQINEEEEVIEVVSPGKFYANDDCYKIVYEETEISGMDGTVTTLEIKDEAVKLIREGSTETTMIFKKNSNEACLYNTPYGALKLDIVTKDIDVNVNENGGKVSINYMLFLKGQMPIETNLDLKVEVKDY